MKNNYNEPEIKITDCSKNEDVITTSSAYNLHDSDDYNS